MNKRRIIAVLCLVIFLINFVSTVIEHHHECHGGDCPICLQIKQNEENIKELGLQLGNITIATFVIFIIINEIICCYEQIEKKSNSLVKLKVMLRN